MVKRKFRKTTHAIHDYEEKILSFLNAIVYQCFDVREVKFYSARAKLYTNIFFNENSNNYTRIVFASKDIINKI